MNTVTLASSTAGRIGQLIRLFNSDKGGEVVAAATALKRTLRGAGLDMHALANVTEQALTYAPRDDDVVDFDLDVDVRVAIKHCAGRTFALTDREFEFI